MAYQTSASEISSTTHIRVGRREFANVELLWQSTFNEGELKQLIGDRSFWFDNLTVRFPDKHNGSCSFVEVQKRVVNVGHPNNYLSYRFKTRGEALAFADKTNKEWLAFDDSAENFIDYLQS
jgi:hypothetical protein